MRQLQAKLEDDKIALERDRDEFIKKSENLTDVKNALIREGDNLRSTLKDVEKSRTELRKEVADVRSQLKDAENDTERTKIILGDTKQRLVNTEEREDDVRREATSLRHQLADAETQIVGKEKENQILCKRINELEDEGMMAERNFMTQRVEMADKETKLKDDVRDLCAKSEMLSDEVSGLKLELSEAQGRAEGLHDELLTTEEAKNKIEEKLNAYASSLRRTLGIGKKHRDEEDQSADGFAPHAPNPDIVKAGLQSFVLELQQTKAARDDARLQVEQTKRKLAENEQEKADVEHRLDQINKTLAETENSKRGVDGRLANAQTAILLQEEAIRRADRERKTLIDQLADSERTVKEQERVNVNLMTDLSNSNSAEARLAEERRKLKELLDQGEAKFTKLEIERRGLEGQLHRSQVVIADKDGEICLLNDRIEALSQKYLDAESKATAHKQDSEKTQIELDRSNVMNANLKERINALTLGLTEKDGQLGSDQQKITHLEQLLTASEHDRQLLKERLDTARMQAEELKKQHATLSERVVNKTKSADDLDIRRQELEAAIKLMTAVSIFF